MWEYLRKGKGFRGLIRNYHFYISSFLGCNILVFPQFAVINHIH